MPRRAPTAKLLIGVALAAALTLVLALSSLAASKPTLTFTTPARTSTAGVSGQLVTVSLSAGLSGPATVKLSTSSASGSFRDAADGATVTQVSIGAGQTQTSFRYRDTLAGTATITAVAASGASPKQWTGNLSGTQDETTSAAALDHLTLAPATATLASGIAQPYTATGFDRFGNSLGNLTAQSSFQISPDGSCAAARCSAARAGVHTVTATDGAAGGQATLTVTPGPLDHLILSPQGASTTAGTPQSYRAEGFDAAGNDLGDKTAQSTFQLAPDGSCQGASCGSQHAGAHAVTATDGTAHGETSLSVTPGPLAAIALSPHSASAVAGEAQGYGVEGYDAYGNDRGDLASQASLAIGPDGACQAMNCSATAAGAHTVTASVGSLTNLGTLQVTPRGLDHLTISPQSATITAGGSQSFAIEGFDRFGNDLGPRTSSLAISPDGSCEGSTCTAAKAGPHTVTAGAEGQSVEAQLAVAPGPLDHLVLSPQSAETTPGVPQSFSAEGYDAAGNDLGDMSAQSTFQITPDGSCQGATCQAAVTGDHTVTAADGTARGEASLEVRSEAPARIEISPAGASTGAGEAQEYRVEAYAPDGEDLGEVTSRARLEISPDGSCTAGRCSAEVAGAHTVIATLGGLEDTTTLQVEAGPPARIALVPPNATIAAGELQAYRVEAFDAHGNALGEVTDQAQLEIAPDGSCEGASCGSSAAGSHTVTAKLGELTAGAALAVEPAAFDHLVISPPGASITAGQAQEFHAEGFDRFGNDRGEVTAETSFQIGPDGSCEANDCGASAAGAHTVTASHAGSTDSAELAIEPGPPASLQVSGPAAIAAGSPASFTVRPLDAEGNELGTPSEAVTLAISPEGSCEGGSCTATTTGPHTVTATDGALSAQTSLQVKPPPTTVSLTFDDGVADQTEAGRILAEHSLAGTFYIISGRVGSNGYLSLANLRQLAAGGNEIADHTVGHLNLLNVSSEEAERQICNARVQLQSWGFHIWDFAYPQGGTNPELEQIVRNCNLNSARIVSNIVSPGDCFGCAFAETVPPADPYAIRTPDSIKTQNTLQDLKNYVIQAQEHGGGWVPLVFHHLCNECDPESVSAQTFSAFLDWLRSEEANNVTVKTVHQVIGGEEKPGVTGPPPPPPSGDLIQNPSLEADLNGNGVPDCWTVGGSGQNTYTAQMTSDANSGSFAEQLAIGSFTSGDRRLVTTQDLGQCAPPATVGDTYTATAQVKGEGLLKWVVYYRDSQGAWTYWTQSATVGLGSTYTQASWTTPPVPAGATALSIGFSLRSVGQVSADDFFLEDDGPADLTPPTVGITSPSPGGSVGGNATYITAQAADNVGVASVRFLLDGTSLGSKSAPTTPGGSTYQWKWDTTTASEGTHTLTAIATDAQGNQTTSGPVTVTVAQDQVPPTTTILCNNQAGCGGLFKAPVAVTLKATDNVGVARTVYTTDGSEPSAGNGTTYIGAFNLAQTTTVRYRSVDAAGNWEAPQSAVVQVDGQAPSAAITSPTPGASVIGNSVYITAQATDNVGVASVRFLLDGTSLGSKASPTTPGGSTYQWKWDATTAAPGPHTLSVIATDTAGNQTTSAPVSVTVLTDTTPPTTSLLCNGTSSCGGWLRSPVTITLKATDNVAVAGTYYTLDGSEPGPANGSLYTAPFALTQPATLRFRSLDSSGNAEAVQTQALQIDGQAPSSQITSPTSGAALGGTVYVTAQATDNVGVASVRFYLDGVSLGSKTAPTTPGASTYQWKWETGSVAKGSHTLTALVTDLAGNQTTSPPIPVTVN